MGFNLANLVAFGLLPTVLGAPLVTPRSGLTIPGKYLVVLKSETAAAGIMSSLAGGAIAGISQDHVYDLGNFKGFAASLSDAQVNALKADSKVAYLEADGVAHTQRKKVTVAQPNAPWGLGRISHRKKGITEYDYDSVSGAGTCSYTIDTGVYASHPEFEGRATQIKSYTGVDTDDNGHGTHVAGTIGSVTYGVAKKTKIYAIKVLDSGGSGAWSDIVDAIQFMVKDSKNRTCTKGVVANMSLGGGKTQAVNDAVAAAVNAGIFFAVAAGNEGTDFSTTSPASEPKAFAVGASDVNDGFASFSNYGRTLGIIAPGVNILSTWNNGGTNTISGTSMATPHVVGLAAYYLGLAGPLSPADLKAKFLSLATTGAIAIPASITRGGTPNRLTYNNVT